MTQFVSQLAKKYQLSEEKMNTLVAEVVAQVEKDLPLDLKEKINEELSRSSFEVAVEKTNVFSIP